ncbi:MAG: FixH family protein [Alphaproteobacteria bacterium]|nr:FixH family protein [Alphaproteobacteria bacterium]
MKRILQSIVLAALVAGGAVQSHAATQDYRFEIAEPPVHMGHDAPVGVKLTNTVTGKPVTGAMITDQKLAMLMGGMAMPTAVKALLPDADGTYRFTGDVTMAGDWQLDLTAQVPGEKDPVHGTIKFQAVK